mmetsp:Transcript_1734/g.3826  ORF Transcript_1734/g.3826 Transcript_1734/m.3826 type:complete len:244 (-) Transcript_1734:274-1005(-)
MDTSDFMSSGTNALRLRSNSESDAVSFFRSVRASASVSLRSVTSTSLSPRTTLALIFMASDMARTNSSPGLKPSEPSLAYTPLMASPTARVPASMRRSRTAKGLTRFGGACCCSICAAADDAPGPSAKPSPPEVGDPPSDDAPSPPPPSRTDCGGRALAILFRSNSTNTASGFTSRTTLDARAAESSDMCAVPTRCTTRPSAALRQVVTDGSQRASEGERERNCLARAAGGGGGEEDDPPSSM